ncbi:MAG: DUF2442 domain-containing protein [Bacteroidales bacterium]|nr:DUF2442 domain-containing protein [Bacteroidales bacterium]
MIPRIKTITPLDNFILRVVFDDGKTILYDVKEDIEQIPVFKELETNPSLWPNVSIDTSRTCIYWNDQIDLPSDILYEYGQLETYVEEAAEPSPTYNVKPLENLKQ